MPITKSQLEARREALRLKADQFRQQYNMMLGAIAECDYWLSQLEPSDKDSD